MSIYQSTLTFSDDRWDEDDPPAPLVYQGSHVLPCDDSPRGGAFMLASIPGFIDRAGRDVPGDDRLHPWLRVDAVEHPSTHGEAVPGMGTVVLDRAQAQELRDYLDSWLAMSSPDSLGS